MKALVLAARALVAADDDCNREATRPAQSRDLMPMARHMIAMEQLRDALDALGGLDEADVITRAELVEALVKEARNWDSGMEAPLNDLVAQTKAGTFPPRRKEGV